MKDEDFLLIGNGLNIKHPEETIKAYSDQFLDNLLIKTLTQIGFTKENLKYGARFKNSRVEMYYTIVKDCAISFLGKRVEFFKGDQIVVAVSYKYDKHDFMGFLKMYFDDVRMYASADQTYALALCKK